jgi:hypothetical protein
MLDAYVIEEIRRRERDRSRDERPAIDLPLPAFPRPDPEAPGAEDRERGGGVVIIDYS